MIYKENVRPRVCPGGRFFNRKRCNRLWRENRKACYNNAAFKGTNRNLGEVGKDRWISIRPLHRW